MSMVIYHRSITTRYHCWARLHRAWRGYKKQTETWKIATLHCIF